MEEELLHKALNSAELIDQFTAKGVIFLMLVLVCLVCYFLLKRMFADMDTIKNQVQIGKQLEGNLEKMADSLQQSLNFLKEDIAEQKQNNALTRATLEQSGRDTNTLLRELEQSAKDRQIILRSLLEQSTKDIKKELNDLEMRVYKFFKRSRERKLDDD